MIASTPHSSGPHIKDQEQPQQSAKATETAASGQTASSEGIPTDPPIADMPSKENASAEEHLADAVKEPPLAGAKKKKNSPPSYTPPPSLGKFFSPLFIHCGVIILLTFFLLIPLDYVKSITAERAMYQREAQEDIASSWGRTQTLAGPLLIVPYVVVVERMETVLVKEGKKEKLKEVQKNDYFTHYKVILPTDLTYDAQLQTEIRYRGIYKKALYTAPVKVTGSFALPPTASFASNIHTIHWDKAWLTMGVSDLKTIAAIEPVVWEGAKVAQYQPGAAAKNIIKDGFHTDIALPENSAGTTQHFSLHLTVRGSGGIYFTPVGEKTTITVIGNWADPNFGGNLLPVKRSITNKGFSAQWEISNLTRTYPQIGELEGNAFMDPEYSSRSLITNFTAGVDLHEMVSLYRLVSRAVNYAILFISVSFVALFSFELITKQRMHGLQYGMVGLSMSLFYLILLSLAEHVAFETSFAAASILTVLMNSLYISSVLQSKKKGLIMALLLLALYLLLYSLLHTEEFTLLIGTGLVIVMMAVLMFVTRKLPAAAMPAR